MTRDETRNHGTVAAFLAHKFRGTMACPECTAAWTEFAATAQPPREPRNATRKRR